MKVPSNAEELPFELKSSAFGNEQSIPAKYTGDGQNLSSPLECSDPPPGAKSLVLVVEGPRGAFRRLRYRGLYSIMAERSVLPEGVGRSLKMEVLGMGVNDLGEPGYGGPAPPNGHGTRHYHFKLAALDVEALTRKPRAKVEEIWKMAQPRNLRETELVGTCAP